jgi:hypothetical protein
MLTAVLGPEGSTLVVDPYTGKVVYVQNPPAGLSDATLDIASLFVVPPFVKQLIGGLIGMVIRKEAIPVAKNAPISVDDGLALADDFLNLGTPIQSVNGKTGVQFIQSEVNAAGQTVTKRVGFDLNPASPHVQQLGPHLNLQTQINGVIQKAGPLADPHIPIDPSTIIPGDF